MTDLLKQGIRVSELSASQGRDFHRKTVKQLYEWWRVNHLVVNRTWGGLLEEPEIVMYSNSEFLLPDDHIQLKKKEAVDSLKIATWNVNSIRIRLPLILSWLAEQQPDIVCLQETKVEDFQFPEQELREAGYSSVYIGQKSYNGVAILSRFPIEEVQYGFSTGFDPDNKRLLSARIEGINVVNVYVPQGQTTESPKFAYKLEFLQNLVDELDRRYTRDDAVVLLGDINIAPDDRDVVSAEEMRDRVSFHPSEHAMLDQLREWGLTDIYRKFHQDGQQFSWWDFRTRGFEKNEGMRIDHIWVTPSVADQINTCTIDMNNRSQPKPSDHAPVFCVVKLS